MFRQGKAGVYYFKILTLDIRGKCYFRVDLYMNVHSNLCIIAQTESSQMPGRNPLKLRSYSYSEYLT